MYYIYIIIIISIIYYYWFRKWKESRREQVEAVEAIPQSISIESLNKKSLGGSLHRLHLLLFILHRLHLLYYILTVRCWLLFMPYHL